MTVVWQYYHSHPLGVGWHDHDASASGEMERVWQKNYGNPFRLFSGMQTYEIDFSTMTQRNISSGNVRLIRRFDVSNGSPAPLLLQEDSKRRRGGRERRCGGCGVVTHEPRLLKEAALTNDHVHKGICIRCSPSHCPDEVVETWNEVFISQDTLAPSKKTFSIESQRRALSQQSQDDTVHASNLQLEDFRIRNQNRLLEAMKQNDIDSIRQLLSGGEDPNIRYMNGSTCLHHACRNGHGDIILLLLEKGAVVNCRDDSGWTPLHEACFNGKGSVIPILLENGADMTILNAKGRTALQEAKEWHKQDCVQLLEDAEEHRLIMEASNLPQNQPKLWGVSYDQLVELRNEVSRYFGNDLATKTMHDVNEHILSPKCRESETSYALSRNPNGLKADTFVTHCWDEPFDDFVNSLLGAFRHHFKKPTFWICALALTQGNSETIKNQLSSAIDKSPFVVALKDASQFIVVRNPVTDLYSRMWCVCELLYAKEFGFIPDRTLVTGQHPFADRSTSCLDAAASSTEDKTKILREVIKSDHRAIDRIINDLRQF